MDPMSSDPLALNPVERVLLISARPSLTPPLAAALRGLLQEPVDWDRVIAAARRNFIVVLLRKHLLAAAADKLRPEVIAELDRLQLKNAVRALEIARVQRWLAAEVLPRHAARHVFLKGAALSHQYYGDMYLRQYRDLDVLVDNASILDVATELVGQGYVVSNPEWAKFKVRDLAAFCRYTSAVELRSPSGILVELHRTLDNTGCVFPVREYLAAGVSRDIGGAKLQVLPCSESFVYLCFHHSRHQWSSLHWCADLEAYRQHPQLDHARVLGMARRLGMETTVAECWKLQRDLEALALTGEVVPGPLRSRLLSDCLAALRQSIGVERAAPAPGSTDPLREPDFPYDWQKSRSYRWRLQLSRLHPTSNDYNAWPLPVNWHWLYYLAKPWRVARSRWVANHPGVPR